jgi:hypothetical protein
MTGFLIVAVVLLAILVYGVIRSRNEPDDMEMPMEVVVPDKSEDTVETTGGKNTQKK